MEQKQEMHDVVEMLLSRMRDYPEDFYVVDGGYVYNKWLEALNTAKQVMRPEEKAAVESALEKAKRAVYMGAALKVMLSPDEPMEETINRKNRITNPSMATTGLSQAQLLPTGISTSSTMLDAASYINQLESRLKQVERQYATNNA